MAFFGPELVLCMIFHFTTHSIRIVEYQPCETHTAAMGIKVILVDPDIATTTMWGVVFLNRKSESTMSVTLAHETAAGAGKRHGVNIGKAELHCTTSNR